MEFTVPVLFTVDSADNAAHASRIVLDSLTKHLANTEEPGDSVLDWRIASRGVSMQSNGVLVVKLTTPAELIEALDGLHTQSLENLGDAVSAPYVEILNRAIAAAVNMAAIKRSGA